MDLVEVLRMSAEHKHHPPRIEIVKKELEWKAADEIEKLREAGRDALALVEAFASGPGFSAAGRAEFERIKGIFG